MPASNETSEIFEAALAHNRQSKLPSAPRHQRRLERYRDARLRPLSAGSRRGSDVYFLDRLLTSGIIEARGCERFGLVAEALPDGALKNFYRAITRSEARHYQLFLDLATRYFSLDTILPRLEQLLDIEASIVAELPFDAALH